MSNMIREMQKQDIEGILRIIRRHDAFDGKCAAEYFTRYFNDEERLQSVNEKNFVIKPQPESPAAGVGGFMADMYNTPDIYWLTWFYVDHNNRGRGYGSQLLQFVIDRVCDLKARKLYLDTSSDPIYQEAISLYNQFGFKIEADLKDYYEVGEDYLILSKSL